MNSFTVKSYWKSYNELSGDIQKQADAKFELWKENPFHPSLYFKCVNSEDNIWSVRVNMDYRALAVRERGFTLRMFSIAIGISILGAMGTFLKSLGLF